MAARRAAVGIDADAVDDLEKLDVLPVDVPLLTLSVPLIPDDSKAIGSLPVVTRSGVTLSIRTVRKVTEPGSPVRARSVIPDRASDRVGVSK